MQIEFRKAVQNDVQVVYNMMERAKVALRAAGISQWTKDYPNREIICADVENQELYVGVVNGQIVLAFGLDAVDDPEYASGAWRGKQFVVVHRLCVDPLCQGKGFAKQAMAYIQSHLCGVQVDSIRLDAYVDNPIVSHLYASLGFDVVGRMSRGGAQFRLYEKMVG